MISPWDQRIQRAEQLAQTRSPAAEMLRFYGEIARLQKTIYEQQPSDVLPHLPALLKLVKRIGPAPLVRMAEECSRIEEGGLFERWLLQPSYEYRAAQSHVSRNAVQPDCPFCGERPQVGVLRGEGDGAK